MSDTEFRKLALPVHLCPFTTCGYPIGSDPRAHGYEWAVVKNGEKKPRAYFKSYASARKEAARLCKAECVPPCTRQG